MTNINSQETEQVQTIGLKALVLKYGKLLLGRHGNMQAKWALLGGFMHSEENLQLGVTREIVKESGWLVKNIRLFKINVYSDPADPDKQSFEPIFVVDALKQTGKADKEVKELKWFPLTALPPAHEIHEEHLDCIQELAALLHGGKTLDLDRLPPVFPKVKLKRAESLLLPE